MTSTSDTAAWPVLIGTARGTAHQSRHQPNQDSAGSQAVAGGGVVVAVADGHGAARHFRSSTGSMLAIRAALAAVEELAGPVAGLWTAETARRLGRELPRAIVDRWRELLARHLASHPYSPDELSALQHAHDGPEIPYGSTLLVGLIVTSWLVCAQIGDGDMLAVRPDGGAWVPVGGDDRLDGFRTTSLCQAGAVASFRTAVHDLRADPLLALQLSTDGYANAQVTDPWQPAVAADLASFAAEHDHGWFGQQIQLWADRCASAQGSGDDTTIALLLAPGSARLAAAARPAAATVFPVSSRGPAPQAQEPPPPGAPEPVRASRPASPRAARQPPPSRRQAALAAVAVVIAAAGIAIGLVASQSSGPAPAVPPASRPSISRQAPAATPSAAQPAPKSTSSAAGPAGVSPDSSATLTAGSSSGARHAKSRTAGGTSDAGSIESQEG
jgi:hypothetical protein